uniref:Essential protein Yae1, N terminal n=1 Tax=Candidatus Kentrum sp. MB TaxID=2138164 RepID=A0A451BFY7_9GAMM|nr:MAG: conserved hypothetical protein (putative transposase or invertase) [Candidatus Kentron sp. MB]VFK77205.1 MAG: conserved hypothetical protein (putative transposase or invertase) [Candidatus Kentron sp. MB]
MDGHMDGKKEGMEEGIKKGFEKGIEKGKEEGTISTARLMKQAGEPVEKIAAYTLLTPEAIARLV